MNYLEMNCAFKIDGYLFASCIQGKEVSFNKAKEELLKHIRKDIETIENMSIEKFERYKSIDYSKMFKLKMSNDLHLYTKSMGKIFRVLYIAKSDNEANEFCRRNKGAGVIADDENTRLVFIAELYSSIGKSDILPD